MLAGLGEFHSHVHVGDACTYMCMYGLSGPGTLSPGTTCKRPKTLSTKLREKTITRLTQTGESFSLNLFEAFHVFPS